MVFQTRAGAHLLLPSTNASNSDGEIVASARKRGRVFMPTPFASISSSVINSLGVASSDGKTRKEPATGLEYPVEFCLNSKPCPQLAGLGVRAKKLLGLKNINVYTVGFYVDGTALKKQLGHKFKHTDAVTLAKEQALFDGLMAHDDIEKTLRLVIAFGSLRRSQFLDALEERLAPPLRQVNQTEALTAFKKQFDDVTFRKGMEIAFTQQGKQLITQVDGKEVGRLAIPALNSALWGIYVGPDPVSPDAKATLGNTLAGVLRQ